MSSDFVGMSQVVLSAALVVATVVYAWYTRRMADVMKAQIELAKNPLVVASIDVLSPTKVYLRVDNVGKGVANDVHVRALSEPSGMSLKWARMALLPEKREMVLLPRSFEDYERLAQFKKVIVDIDCLDIEGRSHIRHQEIDLTPLKLDMEGLADTIYAVPSNQIAQDQAKQLEKIAVSLEKLASQKGA
jgi:hypothetical protein